MLLSGISEGPLGINWPKNSPTSIEMHFLCISSAIADIAASRIKCREVNGVTPDVFETFLRRDFDEDAFRGMAVGRKSVVNGGCHCQKHELCN